MVNKISETVSGQAVVTWLIIAFLVGYFIYKEWPEFKRRVSHKAVKDQQQEVTEKTVEQRLEAIEKSVAEINAKLNRDYNRINDIELKQQRLAKAYKETMEEMEIMMRAMLGVLGGLQEIGANGPTKTAEEEIKTYLSHKAHVNQSIDA